MVGAALLVLLQKALFSAGVSSFYTVIFQGAIMILAVLVGGISASIAAGRSR
jgi:ribose transport system permease protein